jgi:hypothetical protein
MTNDYSRDYPYARRPIPRAGILRSAMRSGRSRFRRTRGWDQGRLHDHDWRTQSRHPTSDGVVSYQRCRCGSSRILVSEHQEAYVPAREAPHWRST